MLTPRSMFSATVVGDGIYAVGGFSESKVLASPFIEFYKPSIGSWQELKTNENFIQRAGHQSICSANDKLVIFGGHTVDTIYPNVQMINPDTMIDEVQKLTQGETKPDVFEHVHTFDGEVAIAFGGIGQPYVYSFDIEENKWSRLDGLSANIAHLMNDSVLQNGDELLCQDDMVTKIFMAL